MGWFSLTAPDAAWVEIEPPKLAAPAVPSDGNVPNGYRPDKHEPYMCEMHRMYFRHRLIAFREELVGFGGDPNLTAMTERQQRILSEVDDAITRLDRGTYGYCEDTGQPIGVERLDARPFARLCLEAQMRHETQGG